MRFVNDHQRLIPSRCPETREPIFFRFERPVFAVQVAKLPCPACHRDHADLARAFQRQYDLHGWRVELEAGPLPLEGYEAADAYTLG